MAVKDGTFRYRDPDWPASRSIFFRLATPDRLRLLWEVLAHLGSTDGGPLTALHRLDRAIVTTFLARERDPERALDLLSEDEMHSAAAWVVLKLIAPYDTSLANTIDDLWRSVFAWLASHPTRPEATAEPPAAKAPLSARYIRLQMLEIPEEV